MCRIKYMCCSSVLWKMTSSSQSSTLSSTSARLLSSLVDTASLLYKKNILTWKQGYLTVILAQYFYVLSGSLQPRHFWIRSYVCISCLIAPFGLPLICLFIFYSFLVFWLLQHVGGGSSTVFSKQANLFGKKYKLDLHHETRTRTAKNVWGKPSSVLSICGPSCRLWNQTHRIQR